MSDVILRFNCSKNKIESGIFRFLFFASTFLRNKWKFQNNRLVLGQFLNPIFCFKYKSCRKLSALTAFKFFCFPKQMIISTNNNLIIIITIFCKPAKRITEIYCIKITEISLSPTTPSSSQNKLSSSLVSDIFVSVFLQVLLSVISFFLWFFDRNLSWVIDFILYRDWMKSNCFLTGFWIISFALFIAQWDFFFLLSAFCPLTPCLTKNYIYSSMKCRFRSWVFNPCFVEFQCFKPRNSFVKKFNVYIIFWYRYLVK